MVLGDDGAPKIAYLVGSTGRQQVGVARWNGVSSSTARAPFSRLGSASAVRLATDTGGFTWAVDGSVPEQLFVRHLGGTTWAAVGDAVNTQTVALRPSISR